MDIVNFSSLAFLDGSALLNILIAAAGLGMVIFFHELGHFLVAKWCNVYVERFSIGFGPPIFSFKWGETEYWMSWIPFGGYVKMLGQDDMDPGQMTDDDIAEDPRSYSAKTVPQRMAIISAGVIMNIITGFIFFTVAFRAGVEAPDRGIGKVLVGKPGWTHGVRMGDTITSINDRPVQNFEDILRGTALSRGSIRLKGFHSDKEKFDITLEPATEGIVRQIGLYSVSSCEIVTIPEGTEFSYRLPGTASASVNFQQGDVIDQINGEKVENYLQLVNAMHENASETVSVVVNRNQGSKSESVSTVTLDLPAQLFVGFGLKMNMGNIEAIRNDSPAAKAGLQQGDKIAKIDELAVENDFDPYRLAEYFSERAGEEVKVIVSREIEGGSPQEVELTIVPEKRSAWTEPPVAPESLLSIPSIGAGYHLIPRVFSVEEGSIAAEKGIQGRDKILKVILKKAEGSAPDYLGKEDFEIEIGEKNWAYAFWQIQENGRTRNVELVLERADVEKPITVSLTAQPVEGWYMPTTRGLVLTSETTMQVADDIPSAISMSGRYTITSMEDIYLTLRGLFSGDISVKGLSGPVNIAKMAYGFADLGIGHFLRFLGLISVNLAVINFLPIPVLDGGHMVLLTWEGVFRRKPPERVVNFAQLVGLFMIGGMMLFVLYQDIFISRF